MHNSKAAKATTREIDIDWSMNFSHPLNSTVTTFLRKIFINFFCSCYFSILIKYIQLMWWFPGYRIHQIGQLNRCNRFQHLIKSIIFLSVSSNCQHLIKNNINLCNFESIQFCCMHQIRDAPIDDIDHIKLIQINYHKFTMIIHIYFLKLHSIHTHRNMYRIHQCPRSPKTW